MTEILATNQEILVRTEPFLKFKKRLFKELFQRSALSEEMLRRKFYKFLETYLSNSKIVREDYAGLDVRFLLRKLDEKFKKKKNGSFVVQGQNVGYIDGEEINWVRHDDDFTREEIRTFL